MASQQPIFTRKGSSFKGSGYEAFFPRQFTSNQPWEVRNRRIIGNIKLRGMSVFHVTHLEEAKKISSSGLTFKPLKKEWGNYYSFVLDSNNDQDFAESTYKHINDLPADAKPLPGLYSWWSMENSTGNKSSSSVYGPYKFSVSFEHALESYRDSRRHHNPEPATEVSRDDIQFKKAGTKRYKYEICYVIIVCIKSDPAFGELENIKLDDELPLHDLSSTPGDHENYVLAFYFPPPAAEFAIKPQYKVTVSAMRHKYNNPANTLCIREIRRLPQQKVCTDKHPSLQDLQEIKQNYDNTNPVQNNFIIEEDKSDDDDDLVEETEKKLNL